MFPTKKKSNRKMKRIGHLVHPSGANRVKFVMLRDNEKKNLNAIFLRFDNTDFGSNNKNHLDLSLSNSGSKVCV